MLWLLCVPFFKAKSLQHDLYYASAHYVSSRCSGTNYMPDPNDYSKTIYAPYVGDTDWAACFVATNPNAAENDLLCPHNFKRIKDEDRDCEDRFKYGASSTLKRICCLIEPTASMEVNNYI